MKKNFLRLILFFLCIGRYVEAGTTPPLRAGSLKASPYSKLDILHNYICSLKLPFLASLAANFSAISSDMPSKLATKSAQKSSIFPSIANYARRLLKNQGLKARISLKEDGVWFKRFPLFIQGDVSFPTLVNSVSFHPKRHLFCVTFTQQHRVGLYRIQEDGQIELLQMLQNPDADLDHPQNAIFSPDGNFLTVVNWSSRHFNFYPLDPSGYVCAHPQHVIPCHLSDEGYRPHGMCFSLDGNYLAVVYGSFEDAPWIVILYRVVDSNLISCSTLSQSDHLEGVPKGIAFSPDGTSLVITFTKTDWIGVFSVDWKTAWINPIPSQEISGETAQLSRPEDIAFSPDGTYCAVSNSSCDTVAFYLFDKWNNRFLTDSPFRVISREDVALSFPHGIGFSYDGNYFAITQFGFVEMDANGYITSWGDERYEGIWLFDAIHQNSVTGFLRETFP